MKYRTEQNLEDGFLALRETSGKVVARQDMSCAQPRPLVVLEMGLAEQK